MLLDGMIRCLSISEPLAEYRELALVLPFGKALFNGSVSYLIYSICRRLSVSFSLMVLCRSARRS